MTQLYYVGIRGERVAEVADAVSTHLNYLGTEKATPNLRDVTKITVEDVNNCVMPRDIFTDFNLLTASDNAAATSFRVKLVHYRILSLVTSRVYENIKYKINILPAVDVNKPKDAIVLVIRDIVRDSGKYLEIVKQSYGDLYHLEKRTKDVFDQIASPRLDDLSLSQAKGFADAEKKRDLMHQDLLAAIKNPKNNP